MTKAEPVRLERRDATAVLCIDRPERKNSLSRGTLLAFGRLGQQLSADRGLRAIIVTAVGSQAFCAGADLKERREMNDDAVREQLGLYRSELRWLDESPVPVVAAINGVALGGGLELALMCDLRVAAEHAEFGLPETGLGIIPGAGGTQRLPRLIGEARAKELILLGRRICAREALHIGLVNRVTPAGKCVIEDTLEWIAPIVQGAPLAQAAALAAIDASSSVPLPHGLELERVYYDRCLRSTDRSEALAALAEKRKPVFRGE
jgi:methylglutaconyl-CoA hydratase